MAHSNSLLPRKATQPTAVSKINRLLEVYVVESKNFKTKIRHANGGWERLNWKNWEGIPSPVEQNERHILVLKELIRALGLGPTRLGMTIPMNYMNCILVNPSCSIVGDYPRHVRIYKMDSFIGTIRERDPSLLAPLKVVSSKTVEEIAAKLVAQHKPAPTLFTLLAEPATPYRFEPKIVPKLERAPVAPRPVPPAEGTVGAKCCGGCSGPVTKAEAYFCRMNQERFGREVLCRKCQGYAPLKVPSKIVEVAARCAACSAGVDKKVVAFSRFNSKRFGGRVLCRECQVKA